MTRKLRPARALFATGVQLARAAKLTRCDADRDSANHIRKRSSKKDCKENTRKGKESVEESSPQLIS